MLEMNQVSTIPTNNKMAPSNSNKITTTSSSDDDRPAAAAMATFFEVPTKTYDGGSSPKRPRIHKEVLLETPQDLKQKDPFLFYSNDANRLAYLLGHENVASQQQQQQHWQPVVRKTKISFEVYPDLLLEDLFINDAAAAAAAAAVVQQEPNQ